MNTRTIAALLALGLLAACDEPPPEDSADVATDTVTDAADVSDDVDATPDTVADTVADTVPDTIADTAPEDTRVADTEEVGDVADEEVVEGDAGTDCSGDGTLCEDPYTCIAGVCRVPLADTTWAEGDFDIVEPDELSAIFDTFKSFASNVKFMVIDVGPGTGVLTASVGSADIVDTESDPVLVRYQEEFTLGTMVFRPYVDDEAPLDGRSWITDPFFYELRASATIEFPTLEPISASFGLDAEELSVVVTLLDGPTGELTTAHLEGYVTRAETEYRAMMGRDDLPAFAALFCREDAGHDPGEIWNLSDVLDCNGADMDVDSDGDGFMDAYRVVIDARLDPAALVGF